MQWKLIWLNHVLGALLFVGYNNQGDESAGKQGDVISIFGGEKLFMLFVFLPFRLLCEYNQRTYSSWFTDLLCMTVPRNPRGTIHFRSKVSPYNISDKNSKVGFCISFTVIYCCAVFKHFVICLLIFKTAVGENVVLAKSKRPAAENVCYMWGMASGPRGTYPRRGSRGGARGARPPPIFGLAVPNLSPTLHARTPMTPPAPPLFSNPRSAPVTPLFSIYIVD